MPRSRRLFNKSKPVSQPPAAPVASAPAPAQPVTPSLPPLPRLPPKPPLSPPGAATVKLWASLRRLWDSVIPIPSPNPTRSRAHALPAPAQDNENDRLRSTDDVSNSASSTQSSSANTTSSQRRPDRAPSSKATPPSTTTRQFKLPTPAPVPKPALTRSRSGPLKRPSKHFPEKAKSVSSAAPGASSPDLSRQNTATKFSSGPINTRTKKNGNIQPSTSSETIPGSSASSNLEKPRRSKSLMKMSSICSPSKEASSTPLNAAVSNSQPSSPRGEGSKKEEKKKLSTNKISDVLASIKHRKPDRKKKEPSPSKLVRSRSYHQQQIVPMPKTSRQQQKQDRQEKQEQKQQVQQKHTLHENQEHKQQQKEKQNQEDIQQHQQKQTQAKKQTQKQQPQQSHKSQKSLQKSQERSAVKFPSRYRQTDESSAVHRVSDHQRRQSLPFSACSQTSVGTKQLTFASAIETTYDSDTSVAGNSDSRTDLRLNARKSTLPRQLSRIRETGQRAVQKHTVRPDDAAESSRFRSVIVREAVRASRLKSRRMSATRMSNFVSDTEDSSSSGASRPQDDRHSSNASGSLIQDGSRRGSNTIVSVNNTSNNHRSKNNSINNQSNDSCSSNSSQTHMSSFVRLTATSRRNMDVTTALSTSHDIEKKPQGSSDTAKPSSSLVCTLTRLNSSIDIPPQESSTERVSKSTLSDPSADAPDDAFETELKETDLSPLVRPSEHDVDAIRSIRPASYVRLMHTRDYPPLLSAPASPGGSGLFVGFPMDSPSPNPTVPDLQLPPAVPTARRATLAVFNDLQDRSYWVGLRHTTATHNIKVEQRLKNLQTLVTKLRSRTKRRLTINSSS